MDTTLVLLFSSNFCEEGVCVSLCFHSLFNEKLPKQIQDPSITHLSFNAFPPSDSLIRVTMTTKCIKTLDQRNAAQSDTTFWAEHSWHPLFLFNSCRSGIKCCMDEELLIHEVEMGNFQTVYCLISPLKNEICRQLAERRSPGSLW